MNIQLSTVARRLGALAAVGLLAAAMGGTWTAASAAPSQVMPALAPSYDGAPPVNKSEHGTLTGKINLNTATADQLTLLPRIGPAKAARIIEWRARHGGFKRTADLRRVKGFGYRTWKRLEPYLEVKGETTLAAQ